MIPGPVLRPPPDIASWVPALLPRVEAALGTGPVTLAPWRQGTDFAVLRAGAAGARYALRVPLRETTRTGYDGFTDFARVIRREVVLHRLLAAAGVPAPRVVAWERREEPGGHSWMLADLVEHDECAALDTEQQRSLGRLARTIHTLRPRREPGLAELRAAGRPTALLSRALNRYRRAAGLYPLPPAELIEPALREAILGAGGDSLLHMDLRPDNLCFRGSGIVGVLDLANSLVGPPAAELGRVYAHGLLTPAFLDGYGGLEEGRDGALTRRTVRAHAVDPLASQVALAAGRPAGRAALQAHGLRLAAVAQTLL
ncbi:phosphotransferase family protein [Streptomyces sp. NPDC001985]|uniref:phosphotransferase family protein n=1 Tax=Streptomyces sp. NPDC001985 TaxID=3154406 RepID=UPI003316B65E